MQASSINICGSSAGFCENPFARNRSSGAENAKQLRRKLSGKSDTHGQTERHRLGRQSGNGLAQGQLSLLLKQQREEPRPAVQRSASPGSRRKQHSLLSMQLKSLRCDKLVVSQSHLYLAERCADMFWKPPCQDPQAWTHLCH